MKLDALLFVVLSFVYFLAWVTGVIGVVVLARYVRRERPDLGDRYFPHLWDKSIRTDLRMIRWLWGRGYRVDEGATFVRQVDAYRLVIFGAMGVVVVLMVALLVGMGFFLSTSG